MQTELLSVTGMTCGGCASKVTRALKAIDGVGDVQVSVDAGEARVQYDERKSTPEQLMSAVSGAGFGAGIAKITRQPQGKGGCCN